jgi:hypothetical protein
MTREEVRAKLNTFLNARYGKQIADLNKNVYKAPLQDDGSYEAPTVRISASGGTQLDMTNKEANKLNPPAEVRIELKRLKGIKAVYRLAIPYCELEIAAKNESYFNYLMDNVMSKAVSNYISTWGTADKVRFGSEFISLGEGLFDNKENDDFLELRITGSWASDEVMGG